MDSIFSKHTGFVNHGSSKRTIYTLQIKGPMAITVLLASEAGFVPVWISRAETLYTRE